MSIRRLALAAVLPLLLPFLAPSGVCAAGLLIHGGPIWTGQPNAPKAEAVLTDGDRIVFVGALAEARARKEAAGARDMDLKGAAAFPGFTDAHAHLIGVGMREMTLNLDQVGSVAALKAAVKAYAEANPGDGPIVGRGWIETHWPERRFPTAADIDAVVPGRAVVLERADGHALVANKAALALGGVTRATAAPAGGDILKDAAGEPTGMLIDAAMALVITRLPAMTPQMLDEAVARGSALYASRGWTAMGNMSVSAAELETITRLAKAGRMPIRVDNYLEPDAAGDVLSHGPYSDISGLVRTMGVKVYIDGALGSRGAALLAPYSDAKTSGLMQTTHDALAPILAQARMSGAQVAAHAIGDRANRLALDWFEEAFADPKAAPVRGGKPRWRIEHAQIIAPADIPRFAKLGVVASMQPSHAIGDLYFAPARLGPERLKGAYAWMSLAESGATIAAGSDAPVEVGSPLIEFYAAVARKDLKGASGPDWHAEEAVPRATALWMLTLAPAYAAQAERTRGSLEAGKAADITVFSKDLMSVPEADILTAKAVLTVVGGKVVFQEGG